MKKYVFTCVKSNTFEVERIKRDFELGAYAQIFATALLHENQYLSVTVEEVSEILHIVKE